MICEASPAHRDSIMDGMVGFAKLLIGCRPVWDAIRNDGCVKLTIFSFGIYEKLPTQDHELLLAALGRYARTVTTAIQTSGGSHHQDTQTSFIPVWVPLPRSLIAQNFEAYDNC